MRLCYISSKKRWHWVSLEQLQTVGTGFPREIISNVSGNRTCRALRTGGPLLWAAVWANTLRPDLHFFPHLMGFILHVRCISFVGEPAVASLYFCSELVSCANAPRWGVPGFVDGENKPTSPTQIQSPLITASEVHSIIHLHCEVVQRIEVFTYQNKMRIIRLICNTSSATHRREQNTDFKVRREQKGNSLLTNTALIIPPIFLLVVS